MKRFISVLFIVGLLVTRLCGAAFPTAFWKSAWTPQTPGNLYLWYDPTKETYANNTTLGASNHLHDWSGNNFYGDDTNTPGPVFKTGQINGKSAVTYNGTSQGLTIHAYSSPAYPLTFASIVNITSYSSLHNTIFGIVNVVTTGQMTLLTQPGYVSIYNNVASILGQAVMPLGTTHLIVVVLTSSTYSIYVDGDLTTGSHSLANGAPTAETTGNQGATAGWYFSGLIGEQMVWKKALTALDVANLKIYCHNKWGTPTFANPNTLIANPDIVHWPMTEGSGTVVGDTSINTKGTATLSSSAAWITPGPSGSGSAIQGNGTSIFISSNSAITFYSPSIVTISFWIKAASYSSLAIFMESGTNAVTTGQAFVIQIFSGGIQTLMVRGGAGSYFEGDITAPSTGVWHNVVFVLDGVTPRILAYIDGSSVTVTVANNTIGAGWGLLDRTLYCLSRAGTSFFENGAVKDVRMWSGDHGAAFAPTLFANPPP